jgi:hypothetical protein
MKTPVNGQRFKTLGGGPLCATRIRFIGSLALLGRQPWVSDFAGRIRGLRKAFAQISSASGGLPYEHHTHVYRQPSLDWEVIGEPLDNGPAEQWAAALTELRQDADAPPK